MRIESSNPQVSPGIVRDESVNQVQQQQQATRQPEQAKKPVNADKLSISQTANSINEAASSLKSAEQFRTNKVTEIKTQLETNSYITNFKAVAEKVIAQIGSFLRGASA
jgi:flagellar biosynthesis anti-sigma factor FlgM